jgi:hypothetical protein
MTFARSPGRPSVCLPVLIAIGLAACTPPDRPAGLLRPLPSPVLDLLQPDETRGLWIGDGLAYYALQAPQGPWSVHLVSADLERCDFRAVVTPASADEGNERRRAPVSSLRPVGDGVPVTGVNGDFFTDLGQPLGPEVSGGTVRVSPRPAFAWGAEGPWIGLVETADGEGRFGRYTSRTSAAGASDFQAIGGFPMLLDGGEPVGDLEVEARPAFASVRHPRTGIGWDADGERLWLVVVDGRASHSVGMSLPELAALFQALGAEQALNLDGGGSTTMWVRGQVVNRPSDPTGERPVANGLWFVDLPGGCGASTR